MVRMTARCNGAAVGFGDCDQPIALGEFFCERHWAAYDAWLMASWEQQEAAAAAWSSFDDQVAEEAG